MTHQDLSPGCPPAQQTKENDEQHGDKNNDSPPDPMLLHQRNTLPSVPLRGSHQDQASSANGFVSHFLTAVDPKLQGAMPSVNSVPQDVQVPIVSGKSSISASLPAWMKTTISMRGTNNDNSSFPVPYQWSVIDATDNKEMRMIKWKRHVLNTIDAAQKLMADDDWSQA